MIHEVKCKDCSLILIKIEKDEILQDEKDMYKDNTYCDVCKIHREKY